MTYKPGGGGENNLARELRIRKDERDKVLDELDEYADGLPPYSGKDMPKVMLKLKIKELRR